MKKLTFEDLVNKSFQDSDITKKRESVKKKATRLWSNVFSVKYGQKANISDFVKGVLIIAAADSATQQELNQFEKDHIMRIMSNDIKQIKSIKIILEKSK